MSDPLARLCSNSPLHYYPGIKCKVHEIKRNSHKCKRLVHVYQVQKNYIKPNSSNQML